MDKYQFEASPINNYTFQYRGKTYECIDEDRDFQIGQFKFIIETQDWVTMENRIVNQLKWGPSLKLIS
jgi:hypothetical protein